MLVRFDAGKLLGWIGGLTNLAVIPQDIAMPKFNLETIQSNIAFICDELARMELPFTRAAALDLKVVIDTGAVPFSVAEGAPNDGNEWVIFKGVVARTFQNFAKQMSQRFKDETDSRYCLIVPSIRAELFESKTPLFGPEVESKFPNMSEDIAEAGKCLALERSTAAVFHLMRVVEIGVQQFGSKLNVTLAAEKNWQNILDEINKAIKAMDQKSTQAKTYAEAAAHLYNVKLGWRNEVMHPKQTYTPDEAKAIFDAVRAFIRDLAGLI